MNALTIISFTCLVVYSNAGGIIAGARLLPAGPTTLVGSSGVVGPDGVVGPAGVVTRNGAVGPNGLASGILAAPSLVGGLGLGLGLGLRSWAPAAPIAPLGWVNAYDDGQWRGEGLWESQDHGPW